MPTIIVTGPVGVGKTTVAGEMGYLLIETDGRDPTTIGRDILGRVGWLSA